MTTTAPTLPAVLRRLRGSVRRVGALSRAEALLLRRNPMALLTALGTPVVGVVLLNALPPSGSVPLPGAGIAVTLTAFALLFPLYYNLVTTLVARREELVLKRLRSGECSDAEILIGAGAPAMTIAWGQTIVGVVAATAVLGMAIPVNPALVIVAVLLGTVVFVLLAAASTAMTRTVEMAQLFTVPVVTVSMALGGMFPPDVLPTAALGRAVRPADPGGRPDVARPDRHHPRRLRRLGVLQRNRSGIPGHRSLGRGRCAGLPSLHAMGTPKVIAQRDRVVT